MSANRDTPSSRWSNWAGNQSCTPTRIEQPASENDIVALVNKARAQHQTVKVVGAGHSWSDVACTDGVLVNLDRHNRVLKIDPAANTVTVQAGIRLKDLNTALANAGLGMHVLGSVSEQSVAGAVSTGTHGSGSRFGNLASVVESLRLVTANGEVLELDADNDPELFSAARISVGALGIISQMTLHVEKAFNLEEQTWVTSFDDALAQYEALVEGHEHTKLWWLPHTDKVCIYCANRTAAPITRRSLTERFDDSTVSLGLFEGLLAAGAAQRGAIPYINKLVAATRFRQSTRVAPAVKVFNVEQVPLHREMEYAIRRQDTAAAMYGLRDLLRRENIHVNFLVEARFVRADDILLSPAFERDTCQIGGYMRDSDDIDRYFQSYERLMLAMDGRPHWGKEFYAPRADLERVQPNVKRFAEIRRRLDPEGMFVNPFVARYF